MAIQKQGDVLHTRDGALFIQLEPFTKARYVGCVDVDTIDEPGGGIDTLLRCFRADGQGWDTISSTRTPPDPVTTTLTELVRKRQSLLEQIKNCPAAFWIHMRDCGYADQFNNYVRSVSLPVAYVGDRGREQFVMREEDLEARRTYAISAFPPAHDLFALETTRVTVSEASSLNDVAFVDAVRCAGGCGPAQGPCKTGFAVADSLDGSAAATANVLFTNDYGATWTVTAADPFAGGESIASVVAIPVSNTVNRVIVARGTTDAGEPAEIAYSDDNGATWTAVDVGSTNAQFAQGQGALFALDYYNIWLVVDGGYIYKSEDGGATWTTQDAGVVTVNDLYAIHMVDENVGYAVGAADAILKTVNGGASWALTADDTGTGADGLTVFAIDSQTVFVGTDDGELWRSGDGGATWVQASFSGSGAGQVRDIVFFTANIGYMLSDTAAPVGRILRTIDGGFSWELWSTPTNSGLNALAVCDENNAWAVGEANGGSGVVIKALPAQ